MRDQVLVMTALMLHSLAYDEEDKPEPSHHKDLTFRAPEDAQALD